MAADELGLTDDQIDKLADMRFAHQKEMISKKAALKEAKLELRQLMRKTEVDRKAALAKQEKISAIKAEIAKIKLNNRLEMRNILTKKQVDEWLKMRRRHGFREAMHRKGGCCRLEKGWRRDKGHGMGMRPPGEKPGPDRDFWD